MLILSSVRVIQLIKAIYLQYILSNNNSRTYLLQKVMLPKTMNSYGGQKKWITPFRAIASQVTAVLLQQCGLYKRKSNY